MNWILKNIMEGLADLMLGALDFMGSVINNVFYFILQINNAAIPQASITFVSLLAGALLVFLGVKQLFSVYVLRSQGDPDEDPMEFIWRVAQAVFVIAINPWFFDFMMKLSAQVASDFTSTSDFASLSETMRFNILNAAQQGTKMAAFFLLICLVMLVGLIIFVCIASIRAAELLLMKVLLPIFALDLLTTSRERFSVFLTNYLVNFFSYALQVFCFLMAERSVMAMGMNSPLYTFVAIGWIVLMLRAPEWLSKYMMNTGVGRKTTTTLGGIMRMIPMIIRRV